MGRDASDDGESPSTGPGRDADPERSTEPERDAEPERDVDTARDADAKGDAESERATGPRTAASGGTVESGGGRGSEAADDAGPEGRGPSPDEHIGGGFFEEEIGPGSAMAHLYRGEIHRMTLWRERLDRTTRWAVVVIGAVLTYAFTAGGTPHFVILVGVAVVGVFCGIEAHRYRGYDMWRSRVRTLQVNAFAYALDPSEGLSDPDWREKLARDYRDPAIKITFEEAFAHRLRRVYYPLALVLLGAWVLRVTAFARRSWPTSAAVGEVPGVAVTAIVAACYLAAAVVAYRPRSWRARGELHEEDIRSG